MGLLAAIAEDEKALEAEDKKDPVADPAKDVKALETKDTAEDDAEELDEKEDEKEPEKETVKDPDPAKPEDKDKDEKPDSAAFARMRRELAAAKRRAEELERAKPAPVAATPQPAPVATNKDPEPNKGENYEAWVEWELRQTKNQLAEVRKEAEGTKKQDEEKKLWEGAIAEFQAHEDSFRTSVKDYDAVAKHMETRIRDSIMALNPTIDRRTLGAETARQLLKIAGGYAAQGLNPAEEMYHLSKERYGYAAPKAAEPDPKPVDKAAENKLDLRKVADNRRKSASPLKAGGRGGNVPLTREAADTMSLGQFSRLTPAQLAELEQMDA